MNNKINKIKSNIDQTFNVLEKGDNILSKSKISNICLLFVIFISFILIYILNILHPLFGDDWGYSMLPDSQEKISTFRDILYTQYKHYFSWGGRSVVHIIAQWLLLIGKQTANVINSIAYVALTLTIYYIANQGNKTRPALLIAINMMIWFFQPVFGSTILWITGSANYLWGTLIILLFIAPYANHFYQNNQIGKQETLKTILMFLFGIIAGWTNENMSVALISIILIFIIYYKFNSSSKKIPTWAISGLVGVTIGAIFMIAAPGNYARMGATMTSSHVSNFSIYVGRLFTIMSSYYYYALSATFVFFILLIIYKYYKKEKSNRPMYLAIIFFIGAIIATLAMIAAPIFPNRASFGLNTFIFIAIAILFANLDLSKPLIKGLTYTVLTYCLLIFVTDYKYSVKILKEIDKHFEARLRVIEEGKKNGQKDFILNDRLELENKALHYFELTSDSTNWHNRTYSSYYNIHSIIIK